MRFYTLTEKEREAIEKFLINGKSTNLIKVLRFRAKRHIERLKKDLMLLEKLVKDRKSHEEITRTTN